MNQIYAVAALMGTAFVLHAGEPVLQEPFAYSDGPLTNVAAGLWSWHSGSGGAANTLNVVGGRAFVNQPDLASGHDDYNRAIGISLDPNTDNTSKLYAGFTVNFSALPFNAGTSTAGSYFAHFKSSTVANEFYSRIGANQEGAAAGTFRIAITDESWDSARTIEFPQDLNLNTDYKIVVRLDLATDQSTLWINPTDESSTSVTATDAFSWAAGTRVDQFALRQGVSGTSPDQGAPGSVYVDDLRVGTDFQAAVIPEPNGLIVLGGLVLLGFRRLVRRS